MGLAHRAKTQQRLKSPLSFGRNIQRVVSSISGARVYILPRAGSPIRGSAQRQNSAKKGSLDFAARLGAFHR
jgi:hypothetical protein